MLHLEQSSTSLGQSLSRAALRVEVTTAIVRCHPQVALKAGIEAGDTFLLGGDKVASVCVAPLKGRDRAVEKAGNMPIGSDKDRTEGPAIAWVHRFDYNVEQCSGLCSQSIRACRGSLMCMLMRSSAGLES